MKMFSIDEIQRPATGKLLEQMTEIMGDLASIQSRVARLLVEFSRDVQKSPDPQGSSNRDLSADGEASSSAVPQDEALHAGTGCETLADHEGHIAKGAGEDEPSALDRHSDPAPTAPKKSMFDRVLDLYSLGYSTSTISAKEGISDAAVRVYVSRARTSSDARVIQGDAHREGILDASLAGRQRFPSAVPVTIRPKAADQASLVIEVAPPNTKLVASRTLVADEGTMTVHGPLGSIQMPKATVKILARMAAGEGGLYDTETLREIGDFPTIRSVNDHFAMIKPRLQAIGVDLVSAGREMFRVRRVEA